MTESVVAKIRAASHNLESRQLLPELGLPFIPQTSYALSASAIRIILNDLVLHRRRCVVELGAGMSTLYLAQVLKECSGAQLISVDHDAEWLAFVGEQLRRIGAASAVRLVHAPLELVEPLTEVKWYSHQELRSALSGQTIDSVIVDGPKARHGNDAETRSHAFAFLEPQLNSEGFVVFMDDINRQGERRIYERWAQEFDLDRVADAEFCGLGILAPRAQPLKFKIV